MLILRHEFNLPRIELCDAFESSARVALFIANQRVVILSSGVKALC